MMKLKTEQFGEIEINPADIIEFPTGILGFEEYQHYVIIEPQDSIFHFLQSVDEPWLSFFIMMPELLRPDYQVAVEEKNVKELEFQDASEGRVYVILTVQDKLADMTANLQAPLVINCKNRLAKQIVLMDGLYNTRHNVLAEMEQARANDRLRKTV